MFYNPISRRNSTKRVKIQRVSEATIVFEYDNYGNILRKKIYRYLPKVSTEDLSSDQLEQIIEQEYNSETGWTDKLTRFNGKKITYDGIGNPLTYHGWTFSRQGRSLKSATKDGKTITYLYNDQGIRTYKKIAKDSKNYTEFFYFLEGDEVVAEKQVEYVGGEVKLTNLIMYTFDVDGAIISFNINGEEYFYVRNLQQDIVALIDENGMIVADYLYDAWGNILNRDEVKNNSIARLNPYRYRGYRYDEETGWYYLNSRYYKVLCQMVWVRIFIHNPDSSFESG